MQHDLNSQKGLGVFKGWWFFAATCLFVVGIVVFGLVYYINALQVALADETITIGVQSSSDILNLSIPILAVFAGFLISFLGMKRFENIDQQITNIRSEIANEYLSKMEKLEDTEGRVLARIDEQVKQITDARTNDTIRSTIEHLEQVKADSEEKIQQLEDSLISFLDDYSWIIKHKDTLEKVKAANIPELYSIVCSAFSSKNKDEIINAIAAVHYACEKKNLYGSENDYYNLATHLAQENYYKEAVGICKIGFEVFPDNKDLLSCLTLYNARIGAFKEAATFASKLQQTNQEAWNWRAFTFLIDYFNYLPSTDENRKVTQELIESYLKVHPLEEKAYMAQYETLMKYGKTNEAIHALKTCTSTLKMTPQCSLRLADYYRSIGEFALAIEESTKSLIGNAEEQANVHTGAIYACRGLSKDAQIHIALQAGKSACSLNEEIEDALKDLAFSQAFGFSQSNIKERIVILQNLDSSKE